jgi:hypothetical protein
MLNINIYCSMEAIEEGRGGDDDNTYLEQNNNEITCA